MHELAPITSIDLPYRKHYVARLAHKKSIGAMTMKCEKTFKGVRIDGLC